MIVVTFNGSIGQRKPLRKEAEPTPTESWWACFARDRERREFYEALELQDQAKGWSRGSKGRVTTVNL